MINYKFLSLSLKIKNNIVKASNINPLKLKELDVPVISANAPMEYCLMALIQNSSLKHSSLGHVYQAQSLIEVELYLMT